MGGSLLKSSRFYIDNQTKKVRKRSGMSLSPRCACPFPKGRKAGRGVPLARERGSAPLS